MLNCTRDEGGPLGLGLQDRGPNHRMLLRSNGWGGERSRKRRKKIRQVCTGKANESEPPMTCRKRRNVSKTGLLLLARDKFGRYLFTARSGTGMKVCASPVLALVRNAGTFRLDDKGDPQVEVP